MPRGIEESDNSAHGPCDGEGNLSLTASGLAITCPRNSGSPIATSFKMMLLRPKIAGGATIES